MNPRVVVVVYKPLPGREKELEKIVSKHYDILNKENLVTERLPIVMRSGDGSIIEIFEWRSAEAIESAHSNAQVLRLWNEFNAVCTYETPLSVGEFHNLFSEFEPVNF